MYAQPLSPSTRLSYGHREVNRSDRSIDAICPSEQPVNLPPRSTCLDDRPASTIDLPRRSTCLDDRLTSTYLDDVSALFDTLHKRFSVTHGISEFAPGQEPYPGTYACRFCGDDLATIHHTYEHAYSCAKTDAATRAKALLDRDGPITDQCIYQRCSHGAQIHTFVPCGKTFSSQREKGSHMREHFRSMTKAGPNGKVPTCFFGSCAQSPEGGRLRRDSPDFESFDEPTEHLWERHGLSTLKETEPVFCTFCDEFLIKPNEYRYRAASHIGEVADVIARVGYTGEFAGRIIVPQICPFCFHDEALPPADRLPPHTSIYAYRKHIEAHLSTLSKPQTCPCYPELCTHSGKLDSDDMKEHLEHIHGIQVVQFKKRRQPLADITNTSTKRQAGAYRSFGVTKKKTT